MNHHTNNGTSYATGSAGKKQKEIRMMKATKKGLGILLTLAMVLTLMPAFTMPVRAADTVLLYEGFENGIPADWSQQQLSGTASWTTQGGGYIGHPASAYEGNRNAFFFGTGSNCKNRLQLPSIDFSSCKNAVLAFRHAQEVWGSEQDTLRVLYSIDGGTDWTELAAYTEDTPDWVAREIPLPAEALTPATILAFEGTAIYSFGICIDNVEVTNIDENENARLSSLSYTVGGDPAVPVPNFSPSELTYHVKLPIGTDPAAEITMAPTTMASGAEITEDDGVTLTDGAGTATVIVQAADGLSTNTYTVNFTTAHSNFQVAGGDVYETLAEAAAAVPGGGTVTMLQDVVLSRMVELTEDKDVTIDLGGFTLSGSMGMDEVFRLAAGPSAVTLKNGQIENAFGNCVSNMQGTLILENLTALSTGECAVYNNADTRILSGTYMGRNAAVLATGDWSEDPASIVPGVVTVTSGLFTAADGNGALLEDSGNFEDNFFWEGRVDLSPGSVTDKDPWKNNASADSVTITALPEEENAYLRALSYAMEGISDIPVPDFAAGIFTYDVELPLGTNPSAKITMAPMSMAAGAKITENDGVTLTDSVGTATVTVQAAGSSSTNTYTVNFTAAPARFETNGSFYRTLAEAVAAVPNGGTVTMLQDVALSRSVVLNEDKAYTIDLGTYALTSARNFSTLLKIRSGSVTVQNGSLTSNYLNCIMVNDGAVILDDLTVSAEGDAAYAVGVANGTVSILSGAYYGTEDAVSATGGTVTITSGRFTSTAGRDGDGCLWAGAGAQILLAAGSEASVTPWLNEPELDVTVTSAAGPAIRIDAQPESGMTVAEGSTTGSLTVAATVAPGGTLRYQWYRNDTNANTGGTLISGATDASFPIPTTLAAGTYYYYCVVSATGAASVRSNAATVTVNILANAELPKISGQPSDQTVNVGGTASLMVTASVAKGSLSYQWHEAPTKSSSGGKAITGATSASFNAPTTMVGTKYYYCKVTNTDNTATGSKTAAANSLAVSVKVNPAQIKTVAKPTADKRAGTYTGSVKVMLKCATPGAKIYYTLDGKSPTTKSKWIANGKTVTVKKTAVLKCMAATTGYKDSPIRSVTYKIKTAKPSTKAVPKSKILKKGSTIKLKASKSITLYYTTNGKNPTTKSKKVKPGKSIKIAIKKTTTLRVVAKESGCQVSAVVKRKYTVK